MLRHKRSRPPLPDSVRTKPRKARRIFAWAVFVSIGALLVWERTSGLPKAKDDYQRYHDRSFLVVNVVDGDTVDIDAPDPPRPTTRIRLWGVDTPEVGQDGRKAMHFAAEAGDFAREKLLGRRVHVVLSPKRSRDKYGRLLAYLMLERGGRMFNEMLVAEGYGYADLRFEHHYDRQFRTLEKRARKQGLGLWAQVTPELMPEWRQRFERYAAETD
ncbi:MAG: thermonuclease family protein [Phycisphaerales bacterium]|nr:MAG: thermonuclease family protein [Phycisphaerales bacterium]